MKKIAVIIVLALLAFSTYFLNRFSTDYNSIDDLNETLTPVKEFLSNKTEISFITNDDAAGLELFSQAQFALIPNIVERNAAGRAI